MQNTILDYASGGRAIAPATGPIWSSGLRTAAHALVQYLRVDSVGLTSRCPPTAGSSGRHTPIRKDGNAGPNRRLTNQVVVGPCVCAPPAPMNRRRNGWATARVFRDTFRCQLSPSRRGYCPPLYGSRQAALTRSYSTRGSCTSTGVLPASSHVIVSSSADSAIAVHPAVPAVGPLQM